MTTPHDLNKTRLRREAIDRMQAIEVEARVERSLAACRRIMPLETFALAETVMLYMPLPSEVDVAPLAIRCFQHGKVVCVPRVDWDRREMTPLEIECFEDSERMEVDSHGIRSPRAGRLVLPGLIDLVIVPGLAFDVRGNRLGRGGGFYDRFLARLNQSTKRIGICFDEQIIDAVPTNNGDERVDMVVTDRRLAHATEPRRV
ncbi:MAG: 5-formyltetrahydrofolate cyclo-ligase [Phycisphaerales bacterium]